ncbi:MAG: glycosyltransferase, partial [Acidimicrobiia bacterium]
ITGEELRLAARHGLLGLMVKSRDPRLHSASIAPYVRLAARQSIMLRHLHRLLISLDQAGVPAKVLKGPNLGLTAYQDPSLRTYTDVDLLVPASGLERALEVIAADPAVPSIPPKGPKADKRDITIQDDSGVRFSLDLHWDLFSYTQLRGCADGASEWSWSESTGPTDFGLGPAWQLPEEARAAFLCAHAVLDHRFRLILFRDLAELARRGVDWERLIEFTGRWRLRSTTYVALLIATRLVEAPVPQIVLDEMRPRSLPVGIAERWLARTDIVRFDGHRPHPLNLAMVLLHDDLPSRIALLAQAPFAFPAWQRRVERTPGGATQAAKITGLPRTKILLLVSSDRRRGAEVFGEGLARGLAELGWDVEFVSLASDSTGPWVSADPVSMRDVNRVGRFDWHVIRELRRRIRESRPDLVFANGAATLRYGVAAVSGIRPRPVLVYASIGEPSYWLRNRRHRFLQRLLHRRTDLVFAVSEATRNQLADILGLPGDVLRVAPTGVPADFLDVATDPPADDLRLLFLGNLSHEKDPEAALRIVTRLVSRRPATLRFVGGGVSEPALRHAVNRQGLDQVVEFVGSVEDVRPHLAWADVLVLTSRTEGFPGAVLEAAAARVPTVGFNVGGTNEGIIDGMTGVLIEPGNEAAFVEALDRLASDPALRRRLGENGRDLVAKQFTLKKAVANHDRLLKQALSKAANSSGEKMATRG